MVEGPGWKNAICRIDLPLHKRKLYITELFWKLNFGQIWKPQNRGYYFFFLSFSAERRQTRGKHEARVTRLFFFRPSRRTSLANCARLALASASEAGLSTGDGRTKSLQILRKLSQGKQQQVQEQRQMEKNVEAGN